MFPFNTVPVDVVPSALDVLLVPLCEGIIVGLVLGAGVLFVMSTIERLLARRTKPQTADPRPTTAQPQPAQPNATLPTGARRPAARPALGARTLPTRPRRTGGPRPTLLAKVT